MPYKDPEVYRQKQAEYRADHREEHREYAAKWYAGKKDGTFKRKNRSDGEGHRNTRLVKAYGITVDDYNQMLANQNGVCAICGRPPKEDGKNAYRRLNVDHDHRTGKVRGLLCADCNRAIGMIGDDPTILSRAVAYLTGGGDAQ